VEWVVREGVGAGGELTQALYAHMNNKIIKKERKLKKITP
jgi:NaMN:DMB phosphoribosyltransferase